MALDFDGAFFPPPEDFLLEVFRPLEAEIPGLIVSDSIQDDMTFPHVVVRSDTGGFGNDASMIGDRRFMRWFIADVQSFVDGPNADKRSANLQELLYLHLYTAWSRQAMFPSGHIGRVRIHVPAHDTPDWATSTGVNQYATLPKGVIRYQSKYRVWVRPPAQPPDIAELISGIANP